MNGRFTHAEVSNPDPNDPLREVEGLDRDHLARITRPERCDTAQARRREALKEVARLDEESDALRASRKALGSDEHLAAIRNSEWFPYTGTIGAGARLALVVDTVLWLALTLSAALAVVPALGAPSAFSYVVAGILAVALAAALAKGSRGVGRHFAVTRLTDTSSVDRTIDRQVRLAGLLGVVAFLNVFAVVALYFLASGDFTSWAQSLGGALGLAANVLLGLSAGILLCASDLLGKVAKVDSLERQLDIKARAGRYLGRYLLVAAMLLVPPAYLAPTCVAAGPVWIWPIDVSDSVDPPQRELAIDALIDSALARARNLGAEWISVVHFSDQELLSDSATVRVPSAPVDMTCETAFASIHVTKSWVEFSPWALRRAKEEAVANCERRRLESLRSAAADERAFVDALRRVTRITPRADVTTRIVPLVQAMVDRPYARAVDVVTDLCDQSGIPVESIRLPHDVPVTVILTRPNPRRPEFRLANVLRAAAHWGQIPGIRITTAAEYSLLVRAAEED